MPTLYDSDNIAVFSFDIAGGLVKAFVGVQG
jgi:hypothetical protein